ncbi:MAG: ABC transporter permease [Pyrinomonadaceae bacterium]|nr:ABC transporter permease [Acidobacteriota bacterium]
MSFILRMAGREVRASWRRLLFFFLCIGVGVGAIVALRSVIQNANEALTAEARLLLTADVQADSTRDWSPEVLAVINRIAQPPLVEARTETIELPTMVRPADASREGAQMVELKGIEPEFPLYGEIKLAGGQKFDHELLANNGVVVAQGLLDRLRLGIGDEIKINETAFQIRGVVAEEPGGGGTGFRLGPRVFVAREAVEATGLIGFGSRARRRMLFKTPAGEMESLVTQLRAGLKNNLVGVRSYRDAQENLNEQFERSENFLSLTGLVILVLGGIGISNVTRVFIEQKRHSIAILKCVGGTSWQIVSVYLAQVLTLGLAGSLFGVLLAKAALVFVGGRFAESLPAGMSYNLRPGAALQGIGLGLMISLLFSVLPLLRIRHIKPNMLLRDEASRGAQRRFDWLRWTVGALVVCGLAALASWQAGSARVGVLFLAGLGITAGLLQLAAMLLIFLVRRARNVRSFALRHAIASLHRPGNQTRVTVMAVGLGVFLILAIQSLEANLLREFDPAQRASLPNMFLIDIQPDQAAGVRQLIEETTGERAELVPTVRARIAAINGRNIDLNEGEMRRERGRLGREYVVTYRPQLAENEEIVAGEFWDAAPSSEPEVSIEEGMRGLGGMDVGSRITFDILGRRMDAKVTSVRRVDWRNARTGFLVLFRPGTLEAAPQTIIGAINGPTDEAARSRFQRALLDKFPNVAVIDVAEIVSAVTRLLDNATLAVSFIGLFVLLSGVLILIGSIAMSKFQRIYEAAVLKTLGARRPVILTIMIAEYGLLGLVAGLIGAAAATGLSYAISRFVFEIEWDFTPALSLAGVAATIVLVMVVGALASIDVLTKKPLGVLRAP